MRENRRIAREIALKVIRDHGFDKHINDFRKDGVATRRDMMGHITSVLNDPDTKMIIGGKGETLFYNKNSNTFICDNRGNYNSTCFKPKDGVEYFNRELNRVQDDRTKEKLPSGKIEDVDLAKARFDQHQLA